MPTTKETLSNYLVAKGFAKPGQGPEQWYGGKWFFAYFFGVKVPVFPKLGYRGGLPAHDCHHMLNCFPTNWAGECQTAAWELASGGCGKYAIYWIDRAFFLLISPFIAPIRCIDAWRSGYGRKNLFRLESERLLAMDIAEVKQYIMKQNL